MGIASSSSSGRVCAVPARHPQARRDRHRIRAGDGLFRPRGPCRFNPARPSGRGDGRIPLSRIGGGAGGPGRNVAGRGDGPRERRAVRIPQPVVAKSEPARRHGRASASAQQSRDHADHPREHRDVRQPQWRRPAGLRGGRAHHRDAANGHREGVRAQRRHVQRERPAILGWQPHREQSSGPADPDRHRSAGRRSTLGAVVSAEIRRQVRHQGRRAEPRRGIRHRPKRKRPLRQRGVRLARIANNRFARRRPRLPARGSGRPRTRAGDGQHHRAGRRLQREPDPTRFAQRGGE